MVCMGTRSLVCVCVCVAVSRWSWRRPRGHPADLPSPSRSWAGIPEDSKVEGPAFTDAIRMYRQSKELYGTWEMLCGNEVQVRPGELAGRPCRGWSWAQRRGSGALNVRTETETSSDLDKWKLRRVMQVEILVILFACPGPGAGVPL